MCSWLYVKSLQLIKSFHFGHFWGDCVGVNSSNDLLEYVYGGNQTHVKYIGLQNPWMMKISGLVLASFPIFISVAMNGQESMLQLQDHRYWQALDLASCTNDVYMHMCMLLGGYENLSLKEDSFVCLVCWPCLTRQGYCVENHYRV